MKRRDMIFTGLATAGFGAWYLNRPHSAPDVDSWLASPANAQETVTEEAPVDTTPVTEMVLGDPNAPVKMIEYASFTCPHCAAFHNGTFKQLKKDYIDTGKVHFTYREAYFDRFGLWASMIARCGGEAKYFGIINLIYGSQEKWARAKDPAAILEEFKKIGRLAGMNDETMDACLQDKPNAEKLIGWYQANVAEHNIEGTPSFIINGEKVRNLPYPQLKEVLDKAIAG